MPTAIILMRRTIACAVIRHYDDVFVLYWFISMCVCVYSVLSSMMSARRFRSASLIIHKLVTHIVMSLLNCLFYACGDYATLLLGALAFAYRIRRCSFRGFIISSLCAHLQASSTLFIKITPCNAGSFT